MTTISMLVAMVAGTASVQMDRQSTQAAAFEARHSARDVAGIGSSLTGSATVLSDGTLQATVRVRVASLGFGDASTGKYLREALDAKRYPFVEVKLQAAAQQVGQETLAIGTVTMHGVSRPISVALQVTPASDKGITVSGNIPLNFEDFGVSALTMLGVPIEPKMQLHFDVKAPQDLPAIKTHAVAAAQPPGSGPGPGRCPPLCAD